MDKFRHGFRFRSASCPVLYIVLIISEGSVHVTNTKSDSKRVETHEVRAKGCLPDNTILVICDMAQSYARMASTRFRKLCWLEITRRGNTFTVADNPISMFGNYQSDFQFWRCIFCRCISVYTETHFCKVSEVCKIILACAYAIKINNPESFA